PRARFVYVHAKGVIVVPPPSGQPGPWLDATRSPSLQRVANRPIIEHVLDALVASGVGETAVLVPPGSAEEIAACIASNGLAHGYVRCLVHDHEADPRGALCLLAEFADGAPVLMHRADG